MNEPELLQVSREAVFKLASQKLDTETLVPTLGWLRQHFETPTSPSIAVYFSEWRLLRQDEIARHKQTPAHLRAYNERLQTEISELADKWKALQTEHKSLIQFCTSFYPSVLAEWKTNTLESE